MTTEPAAVPPETRDWTFVITEGCGACGFVPPAPGETGKRLRSTLMLAEDDPVFANWEQDVTAVEDGHFHQAPAVVAAAVTQEVEAAAAALDAVGPDQWPRPGRRSNGSSFTIGTFAVYVLHDLEHHVFDIARP